MYQAKSGKQPPQAIREALAAYETAQLQQLARGVANHGSMPRNLTPKQRERVLAMFRSFTPA